jgi:hypothetical protein
VSTTQTNPYASPLGTDTPPQLPTPQVSFAQILNCGLQLYISNLAAIVIVTLVIYTPLQFFHSYMDYFVFAEDDLRSSFRLQRALYAFFGIIATAGVIAIGDAAMRGEPLSAWEALGEGLSAWPRMFWSRLLANFLLLAAFLALIIPGIYVFFRLAILEPVAVIEHRSGIGCIKRAYQLTQRRFWLMFGVLGSAYAIVILVGFAMAMPLALFPEIDHWLLDIAMSLLVHVIESIAPILMVAVYFALHSDVEQTNRAAADVTLSGTGIPVPSLGTDLNR